MRMLRRVGIVVLVMAASAAGLPAKIYIQWTQSSMPAPRVLGVSNLVIPWSDEAQSLLANAKKQGYRVYWEATLAQSQAVAEASANSGVAGLMLQGSTAEETQLEEAASKLRVKYPKLKIMVLSGAGKQPEMRGWLVFQRDGILQVSSPTSQPWLDQNLSMVRYERAFERGQAPLYSFSWDVSDPLIKENGPNPGSYALAVAEAGAFHADLVLQLHEAQQKGLATGDPQTLEDWARVRRTISFYERGDGEKEAAAVAVLADDYDTCYEEINLMARHNIPFQVFESAEVKGQDLAGFSVVIAFAALGSELTKQIQAFAQQGGTAVLTNLPGNYPWDSDSGGKKTDHAVTYTVGKGRVIELGEQVSDPETFAQDIRRLMVKQQVPVSLWNSLTTLVAEYPGNKPGEASVELVNYDEEPTDVQVQVRGNFVSARYENPERGCCQELKLSHVDGFTDFVVPNVVSGGRVHLSTAGNQKPEARPTRSGE
ncbi:MAG TPA: hypothetical protein VEJ47_11670 [Candidatus Eremiobacteraceae bacterium]|nr:hypothetical protein [Candidatus Eremiobacteraceae bacterium]